MSVGSPKCTVDASQLRALLLRADAQRDRIERLENGLRIIAGYEQCADATMSNVEVARAILAEPTDEEE
jgi:hypothetical protein